MKKICVFFLTAVLLVPVFSDAGNKADTGIGLDFALAEGAGDFGMSAGITAPWFFKNVFSFKTYGTVFFQKNNGWKPYYTLNFTVMGANIIETANIRLYGGGGPLFIFPVEKGEPIACIGGSGFFGFEFYTGKNPTGMSYFIELGASGCAGSVKKVRVNGFSAKTGIRYCIPWAKK